MTMAVVRKQAKDIQAGDKIINDRVSPDDPFPKPDRWAHPLQVYRVREGQAVNLETMEMVPAIYWTPQALDGVPWEFELWLFADNWVDVEADDGGDE
ncbi:hypothetical protein J4U01_gp094 [Mycobacterium phage Kumao]|uniref:Uncharacterized protein n=1 Tax=Mycobacterium phage Kumao TaxID=2041344 RepID=A0A2D1GPZ2_9CAUD|nr:hypothetical protein J4U01_gp094 [Mycobacterium phage Kumao]ATN94064.1 hypothetical protein SEA_KUMAO_102 [Mycobacterium phage Kumao]